MIYRYSLFKLQIGPIGRKNISRSPPFVHPLFHEYYSYLQPNLAGRPAKKNKQILPVMGNAQSFPETKNVVEGWDSAELVFQLRSKGLNDHAAKFEENSVDGLLALSLQVSDLVEMGYTSGLFIHVRAHH